MSVLGPVTIPSDETIRMREDTNLVYNTDDLGPGVIIISDEAVVWVQGSSNQGVRFEYPHIAVHAVSKDPSSYPKPCLYFMIDSAHEIERQEEEEEGVPPIIEVRFVPANPQVVDSLFAAVAEGQCLHPDPEDSLTDERVQQVKEEEEEGEGEEDDDSDARVGGMGANGNIEEGDEDQYMDAN